MKKMCWIEQVTKQLQVSALPRLYCYGVYFISPLGKYNYRGGVMRILAALLSIVMSGLGQIFNRHIIKGFIYLTAEHVVNTIAHINRAIYLGLNGHQPSINRGFKSSICPFLPRYLYYRHL
jgi:hypothetical protein